MIPDDFDYALPPDRIAQRPARPRDASRLLLLCREQPGSVTDGTPTAHARFRDLPDRLRAGDLLIVNDARVLPARLRGRKRATGGGVEILLLGPAGDGRWAALARGLRRAAPGTKLVFPAPSGPGTAPAAEGELEGELAGRAEDGAFLLTFSGPAAADPSRLGEMPIPPYIRGGRADARDRDDYQTCFAEAPGAVAAPTAGLHFTRALVQRLREGGVLIERVTLQVGWGTFAPLDQLRIESGRLHPESFEIGDRAAAAVNAARAEGRRVIAVGTTTVRVLETAADASGRLEPRRGTTDLFIRPGHRFRSIDALVTNFHLPRSSLLMLVCAFAGRERVLAAYREAVERRYRFYSYGDAMLIH